MYCPTSVYSIERVLAVFGMSQEACFTFVE